MPIPTVQIQTNVDMPVLGFGVFQIPAADTRAAVLAALEAGYRSIDTASIYGNEEAVGAAIKASGIPREQLFVTTKVWNSDQGEFATAQAMEQSLTRLGLDYVDLYLIHWPVPHRGLYEETWQALLDLEAQGKARAVGVSNFLPEHVEALRSSSGRVPVLNQIESHPYHPRTEEIAYHRSAGMRTQAWSPLAQGKLLARPLIGNIAAKHGKSPAQVILRWHLQRDVMVVCKSVTPERMVQNADIFDFELDSEDMAAIDAIPTREQVGPDPRTFE